VTNTVIVFLHSGQIILPHWLKNTVTIRKRKQKTSNFMLLCILH